MSAPIRIGDTLSQIGLALRWKRSAAWIRARGELVTDQGETWARSEYSSGRLHGYKLVATPPPPSSTGAGEK